MCWKYHSSCYTGPEVIAILPLSEYETILMVPCKSLCEDVLIGEVQALTTLNP